MRDFFKPKNLLIITITITLAVSLIFGFFMAGHGFKNIFKTAQASPYDEATGIGHNVSGFAWSENIGWISFNTSDCDTNGNSLYDAGDAGPAGCPAAGDPFFHYGVYIDPSTGDFSGFAWSSNVGWISFIRDGKVCDSGKDIGKVCVVNGDCDGGALCSLITPATGAAGEPPEAPYNTGPGTGAIAKLDKDPASATYKEISGWAKILTLGNDGWIKLRGVAADSSVFGVSVPDFGTDDFSGWAYNQGAGGAGIGWISFNSSDPGAGGGSSYKVVGVINGPPTVENLTAPNWGGVQPCGGKGALIARLQWTFKDPDVGASLSAYQLKVIRNAGNLVIFNSGKCDGVGSCAQDCAGPGGGICLSNCFGYNDGAVCSYELDSTTGLGLEYDNKYRWEVEVWDDNNIGSGVSVYDDSLLAPPGDTDNDDGNKFTFTTYSHEFPHVITPIHFPNPPSQGEQVQFADQSQYYLNGAPSTAVSCNQNPLNCQWQWTMPAGAVIDNANSPTPIITFNNDGSQTIFLQVSNNDGSGYYCEASITLPVAVIQDLPTWVETK